MSERHEIEAAALALLISPKLAKALSNEWRSRILIEVFQRPLSASQFVTEFGGELTNVARCFRQLAVWDFIELCEERRGGGRRGGTERMYRGIPQSVVEEPAWESLPKFIRDELAALLVRYLWERVAAAAREGTLSGDDLQHLSCRVSELDAETRRELRMAMDALLRWLVKAEERARERLAKSGETPIPTTTALLMFRSPEAP